ncbi:GNAT family N-acetyltransferase [Streptomyces lavendulocolor]|uniref:GNAT family N-acetyltransferase n=1 Tax=Streptomyces lavendulocolor TaxID=67316 RepID=UPI003C2CEC6A
MSFRPPSHPPVPDPATDRLVLRTWSPGDLDAVLAGTRLPHFAEDFPAEGDRVIAGFVREDPASLGVYGQRLIIERAGGLVVGSIGLFRTPAGGVLEVGYGVVPSRRGRGYASEAARAMVAHALTAPGVHTVCATVELSNPASARVLEKAGLRRWSEDGTTARYRTAAASPPR